MVRIKNIRLQFLILTPIILLFAAGIFIKSTDKVAAKPSGCVATNFDGLPTNDAVAMFEDRSFSVPTLLAAGKVNSAILGVATPSERWIEIDLSDQKLRAWDSNQVFLETLVSSGLAGTPTPTGEFRVWVKLRSTKMEGGSGSGYYYLPNVPYVMYFGNEDVPNWRGYGIHGTYWHNDFGNPRSHGCVNIPTPVAEKLFEWALPAVPNGKSTIFASADDPGIRVVIHD